MERDRTAVDAQRQHREMTLVGEPRQRVPLEPPAPGRAERRAVGPALPAQAMQLERGREVGSTVSPSVASEVSRRPSSAQLALTTPIRSPTLGAGVARVGLLPAVRHLGDGRLDPLDERHARAGGPFEHRCRRAARTHPARGPEPDTALEQHVRRRGRLIRREHDVAERRLVRAANSRCASRLCRHDREWRDADEPAARSATGDVRLGTRSSPPRARRRSRPRADTGSAAAALDELVPARSSSAIAPQITSRRVRKGVQR